MSELKELLDDEKKMARLTKGIDESNLSSLRKLLYGAFDKSFLLYCNENFVYDIADVIAEIAGEKDDDLKDFLLQLQDDLTSLERAQEIEKDKAIKRYSASLTHKYDFYDFMLHPSNHHLSQAEIVECGRLLDDYAVFKSYTDGYKKDKLQEILFLKWQVAKCLMEL